MTSESRANSGNNANAAASARADRLWLLAVLGAALLMRLAAISFKLQQPVMRFFSHPWEMGLLANSLVHGLGYSSPFGVPTGPTAFIAPGYPTLVAAIFLLFGVYTLKSAVVLMLLNVAAALATIALMMRLARSLFDAHTARTAGLFWAVSLPVLWLPIIFWESSFSALFFVAMLALALRTRRAPTRANWILLGVFVGVAALVNPALLPTFAAIMGWVAFESWRAARAANPAANPASALASFWKSPAFGALALLVVFVAWPIRNAVRFHAFIPLRSTVGFELWMGNRDGATGRLDESVYPMFNQHELALYRAQGEAAYTQNKSHEAWSYIRSHPQVFVPLTARRIYRFWAGTGNIDASVTYQIHAVITTLLGFVGLALLFRRERCVATLFALPMLFFPLPYYITHAEFRYRLNLDPVLTILAAYAATQIVAALAARRSRTASASGAAPRLATPLPQ
jgi:hypothetical protein